MSGDDFLQDAPADFKRGQRVSFLHDEDKPHRIGWLLVRAVKGKPQRKPLDVGGPSSFSDPTAFHSAFHSARLTLPPRPRPGIKWPLATRLSLTAV
jgi:hypothetical protein